MSANKQEIYIFLNTENTKLDRRVPQKILEQVSDSFSKSSEFFKIIGKLEEEQHKSEEKHQKRREKYKKLMEDAYERMQEKHRKEFDSKLYTNLNYMEIEQNKEYDILDAELEEEESKLNKEIICELDEQVKRQQEQLSRIPGFSITNDQQEIQIQCTLLKLVKKFVAHEEKMKEAAVVCKMEM